MSVLRAAPPTSVPQVSGTVFADAVKQGRWPGIDPTTLQAWATDHRKFAQQLTDAATLSKPNGQYGHLFHELCLGQAGTALQKSLANIANLWQEHAADHQSVATVLDDAAGDVGKLQSELTDIINYFEPGYQTAVSHNQTAVAQAILAKSESLAQGWADYYADSVYSKLNGTFGKAPPAPKITPAVPAPAQLPPSQVL
jgi:hypothetical protein